MRDGTWQRVGEVLAVGLGWVALACGGGDAASASGDASGADVDPAAPVQRSAPSGRGDGVEVRYQFVDTPSGVALEAVSSDQVQTISCPSRTCAGLCDDCAAAACRAAGELSAVCERLISDCSSSCNCSRAESGVPNGCGFPACTTDRYLCYVGDEAERAVAPGGPEPEPLPDSPQRDAAGRPASAAGAGSPGPS